MPSANADRSASPPVCDYEGSTYRTDFWEGRGREYEDLAERKALLRLLPRQGQRLLDVGAGFGRLAPLYGGFAQVVLLDYSVSQLEYARQRYGDERFIYVAADIYRLPLAAAAVDTAVMVRVLHHLSDVPQAFAHIARVLVPQGSYVMEFANKRHLKNIGRYLLRRGPNPYERAPYALGELYYNFHPAWVEEALRAVQLEPVERLSASLFRSEALKRTISPRVLAALDGALQRPTAPLALGPSLFIRSRADKPGAPTVVSREQLFRCPACGHEPLAAAEEALRCPACGQEWPIRNGIHIFK